MHLGACSTSHNQNEHVLVDLEKYSLVELGAVNRSCRRKISQFLDGDGRHVTSSSCENPILSNWEGLGELVGLSNIEIEECGRKDRPTMEIFRLWEMTSKEPKATIGNLLHYLKKMERFDVIQDCAGMIMNDVQRHIKQREIIEEKGSLPKLNQLGNNINQPAGSLVLNEEVRYDAFVIYNCQSRDDHVFVQELIEKLEDSQQGFKLFIPGRNSLPGGAQYEVTADVIEKLCKRCLVILSQAFHESPECDFALKFAQSLSPGARSKRVVPIMIEKTRKPNIINFVAQVDFYNENIKHWQWDRIFSILKAPFDPSLDTMLPINEEQLKNISLNVDNHKRLWDLGCKFIPLGDPEVVQNIGEKLAKDTSEVFEKQPQEHEENYSDAFTKLRI